MEKFIKAMLLQSACTLAGAVLANVAKSGSADPDITQQATRDEDVEAVRLVEIFYPWLLKAYNSTGKSDPFADPVAGNLIASLGDPTAITALLSGATKALSGGGALGLLAAVKALLTPPASTVTTPPGPLPEPGATTAPAATPK